MSKYLLALLLCNSLIYTSAGSDSMETVDDIVTWGAGISGGTSLILCSKVKRTTPMPISFYTFNGAMATYWAMDQLISDENKKASSEAASSEQNGNSDEQNNSYARSKDLAKENKKAAKKKGMYKQAAAVVMMASAVLAMSEDSHHEEEITTSMNKAKSACNSAITSGNGTTASDILKNGRCKIIGKAKVACTDEEGSTITNQQRECNKLAEYIKVKPKMGCIIFGNNYNQLLKIEESKSESLDFSKMVSTKNSKKVLDSSIVGSKFTLTNNPITKALTLGGLQLDPGTRSLTYGTLGVVVGLNATFNNIAAKKFEEDEDYYQQLIDGQEDCGDNCHTDGTSTSSSTGNNADNINDSANDTQENSDYQHREDARYHKRYEKNGLTVWYLDKKLDQYPNTMKVVIVGCGEITITNNNGVRHENGNVAVKNSEVPGRGTAIISNKTCRSTEAYALY